MIGNQDNVTELEQLRQRTEALEETVETVIRPVTDLLPPERVNAIELSVYEMQRKLAALEVQIAELQALTAEALQTSKAVVNSRIWQALVKSSSLILRMAGRGH
jgi:stress response protein YsnF